MRFTRRTSAALTAAALIGLAGNALASSPAPALHGLSSWTEAPKAILWEKGHASPGAAGFPDQNTYNNLIYHGGKVMHRPHVYLVFWGTEWKAGFKTGPGNAYTQKTAMRYISTFFAAVGGSKWHGTQTQYCDGIQIGSVECPRDSAAKYVENHKNLLSGVWVDPTAAPATILTTGLASNLVNDPVATEAIAASTHFHTTDPDALFMIYTPPGHAALAYGSVYCAYHSQVFQPGSPPVRFAFMPYPPEQGAGCGGNSVNKENDAFGHGYLDSYTLAGGHEFEEAVTDPDNNSSVQDGWNDYQTSENGDKCAYFHAANVVIGKLYWAVQPMWSNEANNHTGGCAMARGTGPAPVPPVSPV